MKITKERLSRSHPNLPAEIYYVAKGTVRLDGKTWTIHGTGATPTKAKLDLLWQAGRRRTSPNGRY